MAYQAHHRENETIPLWDGPWRRWKQRSRAIPKPVLGIVQPALAVVFVFLTAIPSAPDSNSVKDRERLAQDIVNRLRAELSIAGEVEIALVKSHPLVFAVEPLDPQRRHFRLSMERGFFEDLNDDELFGALAHEMGHVWIYTHRPFLQTEVLANLVGQKLAGRARLEKVYSKLWAYEQTAGVPMDQLLGPTDSNDSVATTIRDAN